MGGLRTAALTRAGPGTSTARVAAQLRRYILRGRLRPGDRLSTEHELATTFGVSRVVIREALKQLEGSGLLQPGPRGRAGGGARVAGFPTRTFAEMFAAFVHLQAVPIPALVEFRVWVESAAARAAAERRSAEHLAAMQRLVEQMERPGLSWERYHDLDVAFHVAVARASGNPCAAAVMEAAREALRRAMLAGFASADDADRVRSDMIAQHRRIFELIARGDAERAERTVRDHILDFYGRLFPTGLEARRRARPRGGLAR